MVRPSDRESEKEWRKAGYEAKKVLEQSGTPKQCALCGYGKELEVDHVNGNHFDNMLENLRYLCKPCHMCLHIPAKYRSWGRKDFSKCSICGKTRLCGKSPFSGRYTCPSCFRREFKQEHRAERIEGKLLSKYVAAFSQFLNTTPGYLSRVIKREL